MVDINIETILDISHELQERNDYIPLVLHRYLLNPKEYYKNMTPDAKRLYYKKRTELQGADYISYLEKDLMDWIKKNPKYEKILI